ncbi:MAG: endolytic transglycosylase MltG [Ruminococcus sp.]|nr:endolytic transglycosylase MltG [Ruminococcus sp.]
MDNNNNERNTPDISFGSGAPTGLFDDPPESAAAESRVILDKDKLSAPAEGSAPVINNSTAARKQPVQMKKPQTGAGKNGAPQKKAGTSAERKPGGTAPVKHKTQAGRSSDETRRFVSQPRSANEPDVSPENDDATRHFGRAAAGNTAQVKRQNPPRRQAAEAEHSAQGAQRRRPVRRKKKEHMFNTSIITGLTITIVVISASIVLATNGITLGMEYLGYNKSDREVTFNIPEGADSEQIIDLLIDNNIITNRTLFKAALRIVDEPILYPGDITLSPNTSYPEIIKTIGTQRELYETVTLTFQEGTNLRAIAAKLEKNNICKASDFLWQFNRKLDLPIDSKISHSSDVYMDMEGYFFPDTYEFYVNDSPYNVSKIVRENFDRKITPEMYARMNEIGMDLNQVITLASIVQWEAGNTEQMPTIASIFLNRLKDPQTFPNLQSDATKNYVEKVIDRVETSTAMLDHYTNVYDTYVCFGLPAGPVCSPGLDAINAVLYPADTKYYYFCHNLDTGEVFYAESYEQHQKNLKKAGLKE